MIEEMKLSAPRKLLQELLQGSGGIRSLAEFVYGEGRCPVVPLVFKNGLSYSNN